MKRLDPKLIRLNPQQRLHRLQVPVIGLTGGIATGKTTVAKLIIKAGVPLIDADRLVKDIYAMPDTEKFIKENYPQVFKSDSIEFPVLREIFFKDHEAKKKIENFIYSRIPVAFGEAFEKLDRPPFVVYDVPLLFEKGLDSKVDLKVLVYAPRNIQKARLMARDGHLGDMAETILDQQMDIEEKKDKSDIIIHNEGTIEELAEEVREFLRQTLVD